MNPKIQLAYNVLWSAHPVLQLSVAAVMFKRKLHRQFPVFFAYIIFQALMFFVLFPIYKWGDYPEYFYTYWISSGVSLVLGFMIIHEIFLDVFHPYHTLRDLGSVLFRWAALVMLLVAGVVAASSPAGAQGPLVEAVMTVQRCVRVIQCGLILFLLVFSRYLGVSWRQHSFGIALGFGAFAGVELTMLALNASSHASEALVNLTNLVGYNLAIATWFAYAWLKSPARENVANLLMSQRWEQSLTDLQHPVPSDSLIPMFEGMVDRAFSRSNGDEHQNAPLETVPSHKKAPERIPALAPRRFASKA
jgi:hypothetical protein